MAHPLILQLRFTRAEFQRGLEGVTEEEAVRRFQPMNCIAWNVGHLAWQEQRYWLTHMQGGKILVAKLNQVVAYNGPATTPSLAEMWEAWRTVTQAVDPWLDALTTERLQEPFIYDGTPQPYNIGSRVQRNIYHYWYHN